MPRNGSGVFSVPAGTTATPNTPIESAKYNAFVADLTNDLNLARPIVAGGTGSTTKSGAQQALDLEPGVDIQAYNAKLAALAALTLAADKLIYATGADTLAASDLTAFARTLLAEVDAAGMRDELGLGDMAVKDDVAIADIDATGTADATTFLRGDGVWGKTGITWLPAVALTSLSQADFTNIPAGVQEIVIAFNEVSLSGSEQVLVRLGTSGGIVTTGYTSASDLNGTASQGSSGFVLRLGGNTAWGPMRLDRYSGNSWVSSHAVRAATTAAQGGGAVTLADGVTQVRILGTGTSTFTGGTAAVGYR